MRATLNRLLHLDRRWVFATLAVTLIICQLSLDPSSLPINPRGVVRNVFERIEQLDQGAPILIALDFDTAASSELEPMAVAVLRHAFQKKLRVVVLTLWPRGKDLMQILTRRIASEYNATETVDYVYLGYGPGEKASILAIGQDLHAAFRTDNDGRLTRGQPVLQGVRRLGDFAYLIVVGAGDTAEYWVAFGHDRTGVPMSIGCTAVMAPDAYPFYQARQIDGILGGMAGGWDYETLIGRPGPATQAVATQSAAHILIIGFIIFCNITYAVVRWSKR